MTPSFAIFAKHPSVSVTIPLRKSVSQHVATVTHQRKLKEKPKEEARASQIQHSVAALYERDKRKIIF
jgi:hypothetical protein